MLPQSKEKCGKTSWKKATHHLRLRHIRVLDILFDGRVSHERHVASATSHALKCARKTSERIVARASRLQLIASAFLAHVRRIVAYTHTQRMAQ